MAVEGRLHGFAPARPSETITLADVLAAFRGDDVDVTQTKRVKTRLDQVLSELERDTRARTEALTLADAQAAEPTASQRSRTSTPARARSVRRCRKRLPVSSAWMM